MDPKAKKFYKFLLVFIICFIISIIISYNIPEYQAFTIALLNYIFYICCRTPMGIVLLVLVLLVQLYDEDDWKKPGKK